ncbi:MAG: hypothetical protein M3552_22825 [Planctomycetota bacterium]|nr:hypothetical protein [Planctomycetota bacterium]
MRSTLSGLGRVELRRRRFELPDGTTDVCVDDLVDLSAAGVSLAAREMCCRAAVDAGSFARAASNLDRLAGLRLSDEKLRQVVESEGRAVLAWQDDGQMELDFDAGTWATDQTPDGKGTSRAYVGIDGFMLPVVSDVEAGRRFERAVARRKTLKRRKGVRRPTLRRRAGADQRYKEMKLVTIYNQDKDRRLARVTRHGAQKASQMLRQMAGDVRLRRADQMAAVTDGAEWIAKLIDAHLPRDATVILDYYHASQHVHQARRAAFGESSADGQAWAGRLLEQLLTRPFDEVWQTLVETRAPLRAKAKRQALDDLMRYLGERRAKVHYAAFHAAGLDIGSGPTESMCKSLSRRMKGIGMRWTPANAESMVALEALHQSQLWSAYWSTRLAA